MKKWEYLKLNAGYSGGVIVATGINGKSIADYYLFDGYLRIQLDIALNKLGEEGWEMVSANNEVYLFKRPIE